MKPIFVSLAAFLIVASFALANAEEVPAGDTSESSINPDSIFWGMERALDKISLALTFNDKSKAEKGLEIARERLAEFEKMAKEGKMDAAEKAKISHDDFIMRAKAAANEIRKDDKTEEMEQQTEIEKRVLLQEQMIERAKVRIKTEGNLTAEQNALINSFIASMQNRTGSVKIEISQKKEKLTIEIKQGANRSKIEIENDIKGTEGQKQNIPAGKKNETTPGKALEEINNAKEEIAKLEAEIAANTNNVTGNAVLVLRDNAKSKLSEAESAYAASKHGEAYGLANAAGQLAKNARKNLEKLAEKELEREQEREKEREDEKLCIQVITPAKNKATGECKEFPTPCAVPKEWEKVEKCSPASLDGETKTFWIEDAFELFTETRQNEAECKARNISIVTGGCFLQNITYDRAYLSKIENRMAQTGCWEKVVHRFVGIKKGETAVTISGTCEDYNKIYKIKIKA